MSARCFVQDLEEEAPLGRTVGSKMKGRRARARSLPLRRREHDRKPEASARLEGLPRHPRDKSPQVRRRVDELYLPGAIVQDRHLPLAGLSASDPPELEHRGLDWHLKRYERADAAWDAWAARAAWDVRDAWDASAVRAPSAAWDAWAASAAWDAWAARAAWATWATLATLDARAAWGAWDALTVFYASLMGWVEHPADLLTVGLRDAYEYGLGIALPTGPSELGWAMDERRKP